jgi:hypothetical protein
VGESLLYRAVESRIPLLEITVKFVPEIDYSQTTIEFNLLGEDIYLNSGDWYNNPRLRVCSATAEALYRLFGWKVHRKKSVMQNSENSELQEIGTYCWEDVEPWSRVPPGLEGKIESMGYSQPGADDDGQCYEPEYAI